MNEWRLLPISLVKENSLYFFLEKKNLFFRLFLLQFRMIVDFFFFGIQENLKVKNTVKTSQDVEELKSAFSPGNTFGFNAMVEFESENVTENLNS